MVVHDGVRHGVMTVHDGVRHSIIPVHNGATVLCKTRYITGT